MRRTVLEIDYHAPRQGRRQGVCTGHRGIDRLCAVILYVVFQSLGARPTNVRAWTFAWLKSRVWTDNKRSLGGPLNALPCSMSPFASGAAIPCRNGQLRWRNIVALDAE